MRGQPCSSAPIDVFSTRETCSITSVSSRLLFRDSARSTTSIESRRHSEMLRLVRSGQPLITASIPSLEIVRPFTARVWSRGQFFPRAVVEASVSKVFPTPTECNCGDRYTIEINAASSNPAHPAHPVKHATRMPITLSRMLRPVIRGPLMVIYCRRVEPAIDATFSSVISGWLKVATVSLGIGGTIMLCAGRSDD